MITLYDNNGCAIAYVHSDDRSIFLFGGEAVAYIEDDSVYSYAGRYLGWTRDGWFFDRSGKRAFFTEPAKGGPTRATKQLRPVRGVRQMRPVRSTRETRPQRPVRSLLWSNVSSERYFQQ